MSEFRFSAPGKLYLLGEYAVLEGAPALLTAVNRRVTVSLTESKPESGWSLAAPDLGIAQLALETDARLPGGLSSDTRSRLTLVDEVREAVDAVAPSTSTFDIVIESAEFHHHGHKLGLGSSAAVAVALTAAFTASRGISLSPSALFTLAASAHSASQGGRGSGGDIAASVNGGHILFRQGHEPHGVNWPHDLALFVVTTGTGSSTVDLVGRVADYAARDPASHRQDLDHLAALARLAESALDSADSFLALAERYFRGIDALDTHARAGIVTQRHRELRALAAESGAVFKTSGAGGGDVGLIFAKLDSADHLLSVFTEAGAAVIPVTPSLDGVRSERA